MRNYVNGGRLDRDRGSAAIEAPMAAMAMILMLLLVVGGIRVSNMNGDVRSAARAGARAAAAERTFAEARAAADRTVAAALAESGVGCQSRSVGVSGNLGGGIVSVSLSCSVSLRDVALAGFPGSRTVTAVAVERSDELRSGR